MTAEPAISRGCLIEQVGRAGDSIGGVVECVARHVPKGLGMPVFDKLEADLAKGAMSLPASKGFEIGSGFAGTLLTGSEHNDEFYIDDLGQTRTRDVLEFVFLYDLTQKETAERLGISSITVSRRVKSGLKLLKQMMVVPTS